MEAVSRVIAMTINGVPAMSIRFAAFFGCVFLAVHSLSANNDPELAQFQGDWNVVQLVENGQVIPKEAIKEWLPSGGRAQIAENAIIFKSPHDGQKHVKLFTLDPTQYPKGIDISTREKQTSQGIYRFDNDRLIVCFSDPAKNERPTDFSAAKGSNRMLMTLARTTGKTTAAPPAKVRPAARSGTETGAAAKVLTDAQVKQQLIGVWRFTDSIGPLLATINADGSFMTTRDVAEIRLFQTVFARQPVSVGTWSVQNGQLIYHIATSTRVDRAGMMIALHVRSISEKDLIFVDGLGRVGTALKVQ
jgi:uncharacterized protein (TIGR03067 family)